MADQTRGWIVFDARTQSFRCDRCGKSRMYWHVLPIEADVLVATGKAFTEMHAGCKPESISPDTAALNSEAEAKGGDLLP